MLPVTSLKNVYLMDYSVYRRIIYRYVPHHLNSTLNFDFSEELGYWKENFRSNKRTSPHVCAMREHPSHSRGSKSSK